MAGKPWQAGQLDILVKASAHSSFAWIFSTRESTFFPSLSACENVRVATKLLRSCNVNFLGTSPNGCSFCMFLDTHSRYLGKGIQ